MSATSRATSATIASVRPRLDGFPYFAEALRQAGTSTFPQFALACWEAGVVRYEVNLTARTCSYHGPAGERYVESYARVDIP